MPHLVKAAPKYRKHKATGQAVVTINGHDFYLGVHDTESSPSEYHRIIAEWEASGRSRVYDPRNNRATATDAQQSARHLHLRISRASSNQPLFL